MTRDSGTAPSLHLERGQLRIERWPPELAIPFGLRADGDRLTGPARMRPRARLALQDADIPFADTTRIRSGGFDPDDLPPPSLDVDPLLTAHALADNRGLVQGLAEERRFGLVEDLIRGWGRMALVLTPDSAAAPRWRQHADAAGLGRAVRVAPVGTRDAVALARTFDLLVVEAADLMPAAQLLPVLDGSPALGRLGFLDGLDTALAERLAPGLGSVLHCCDRAADRTCHEVRVPLPAAARDAYDRAWHTFFAAFDRFAAQRPDAGFGAFVDRARNEPAWRPALQAWHRANQIAGWHDNKLELVGDLTAHHAEQRTLVFTPTRQAAYELAHAFLLPAVTAEIPAAERRQLVDGFVAGDLPVLVGPRLLDLGVPEGAADVAILAGGGFGAWQRDARASRVRTGGEIVEVTTLDTVEVGRAHRWRARARPSSTAGHDR